MQGSVQSEATGLLHLSVQEISDSAVFGSPHLAALVGWQRRLQDAADESFAAVLLGELAQALETPYAWLLLEDAEGLPELRAQYGFEPEILLEPLRWPVPMPERHQVVSLTGEPSEPLGGLQAQAGLMISLPGRRGLCGLGSQAAREFSEDDRMLLGGAVGVLGVMLARDERIAAEVQKKARQREEAELHAARLAGTQARENERMQLARELHDEVLQTLIGISYGLAETRRTLDGALDNDKGALIEGLEAQRRHILQVARALRLIISRLRPAGIEEFGLIASLQNLLTQFRRSEPGVKISFPETSLPRLPLALELALFRLTQEAFRSLIRREQVASLALRLEQRGDRLCLSVTDEGEGIVASQNGLRERLGEVIGGLEAFGGRVDFTPGETGSFQVTVRVPLPR